MNSLELRVRSVQTRIDSACSRADRDPATVTLVAVSKTVGRREIDMAYRAGLRDFAENRVQDAAPKLAESWPDDARRHMIGSLQSNKAGIALDMFDVIHSVDRRSLIDELRRQAGRRGKSIDVLLQVNVAEESQKAGCAAAQAGILAGRIIQFPELKLLGLMTMAPLVDDPQEVRPVFAALRDLREQVSDSTGLALPLLSMGMTNDFEVAIEEGATHVRIGRALFAAQSAGYSDLQKS